MNGNDGRVFSLGIIDLHGSLMNAGMLFIMPGIGHVYELSMNYPEYEHSIMKYVAAIENQV